MKARLFLYTLLCVFCIGCSSAMPPVQKVSTPTSPVHSFPTTSPTLASTPKRATGIRSIATPTTFPTPVPATHPTLGDTITTWDTYYPNEMDISTSHQHAHQYYIYEQNENILLVATFDPTHDDRVLALTFQETTGDSDAANTTIHILARAFLPNDALSLSHTQTATGVVWYFTSTMLIGKFPASYYIDNTGASVAEGSCTVFYLYDNGNENKIAHISITLGAIYGT